MKGEDAPPPMEKRKIRLEDGRYLIFYTFGAESNESPETEAATAHANVPPESISDV